MTTIPQRILFIQLAASDGGPVFVSKLTESFLKSWRVHHRISSAFPHSNSRAEIEVKTIKRMIVGNTDSSGRLNTDAFQKVIAISRSQNDSALVHVPYHYWKLETMFASKAKLDPRKWDKTSIIIEVKLFDQFGIKVDELRKSHTSQQEVSEVLRPYHTSDSFLSSFIITSFISTYTLSNISTHTIIFTSITR